MAKKDYAKLQASAKPDSNSSSSSLSAVGIVLPALLCFAAGYWLGGEKTAKHNNASDVTQSDLNVVQSQLAGKEAEARLLLVKIEQLQEQVESLQERAKQGAHTKLGALKFYQELPEQSVTPAPVAETKPAPARAMEHSTTDMPESAPVIAQASIAPSQKSTGKDAYKIQLASFRSRSEAAIMQQKLMKSGLSSFVRAVELEARGQWFRVYTGPYADKDVARDAVREIQKKMGIRGLLVRGS